MDQSTAVWIKSGDSVMKAVVLHAPYDIRIEDVPMPSTGTDGVIVQVEACGISGTCLRSYRGDFPGTLYPTIPGLEAVGHIVETGSDVSASIIGRRVVIEPFLNCRECGACRRGRYNVCTQMQLLGVHVTGAMAEFVAVPSDHVHRIPDDLAADVAVFIEPFAIAAQALSRLHMSSKDRVVVLGAGVIGLTIVMAAAARGAHVLVVEPVANRRSLAIQLGAEEICDSDEDTVVDAVKRFTGGQGADVVVEATGSATAMMLSTNLAGAASRVGLIGIVNAPVPIQVLAVVRKELDVLGIRNSCGLFPEAIDFVTTRVTEIGHLISAVTQVGSAPAAFRSADERGLENLRTILHP